MASYLLINKKTGLIENNIEWDGNKDNWSPSDEYDTMLADSFKPEITWEWNEEAKDWVEVLGEGFGDIGETWDGTKFIQPKPPQPQTIES